MMTKLPNTLLLLERILLIVREVSIDTRHLPERETNIMTQGKLDRLRESSSFPARIQIRLPKTDETIASTRMDEVAFYESTF